MNYENQKEVTLMTWETDLRKRNINNIISVNAKNKINLKEGDSIIGLMDENAKFSTYTIEEVISKRPFSLSGYTYYTCSTTWKKKPLGEVSNGLSENKIRRAEQVLKSLQN